MKCRRCKDIAVVALPSHNTGFCRDCFLIYFRKQVEQSIRRKKLFTEQDNILVAVSGGKDSLALTKELKELNYRVSALHVDLNIPESSPKARAGVEHFCRSFDVPLFVLETKNYGLPIPEIKRRVHRPICSVCGSIKRYFFNRFAVENGFTVLATGHNLNDETARLFSNVLSWDQTYLSSQTPCLEAEVGFLRKVKPLYRLTEFETANYCFLNGIEPVIAPCPYSVGATFTFYKTLLADLEEEQPGRMVSFYEKFLEQGRPAFQKQTPEKEQAVHPCQECGCPTSSEICSICRLRRQMADPEKTK